MPVPLFSNDKGQNPLVFVIVESSKIVRILPASIVIGHDSNHHINKVFKTG